MNKQELLALLQPFLDKAVTIGVTVSEAEELIATINQAPTK